MGFIGLFLKAIIPAHFHSISELEQKNQAQLFKIRKNAAVLDFHKN
jgi:hypothetical protein